VTEALTQIERVVLEVTRLSAECCELIDEIDLLTMEVQELKDIFRSCACFGTNLEDGHDTA